MSKDEKLIERIETYPTRTDIRFYELSQYLKKYGFDCKKRNGGSHHVFKHRSAIHLQVVIPAHDKNAIIKKAYVLEAINVVTCLKEEEV